MARMDGLNKVVTAASLGMMALVVAALAGLLTGAIGNGRLAGQTSQPALLVLVVVVSASAIALGLLLGVYRPRRMEISPLGLLLVWPMRSTLIRPEDIKSIDFAGPGKTGRVCRVLGMGGLFGTFGLCRCRQYGLINAYLARRDGRVIIVLNTGRPLLVTPDRAEQFLVAARAMMRGGGQELD